MGRSVRGRGFWGRGRHIWFFADLRISKFRGRRLYVSGGGHIWQGGLALALDEGDSGRPLLRTL